jgi:hypothetical protein
MRISQCLVGSDLDDLEALASLKAIQPGLLLAFGSPALLRRPEVARAIRSAFPDALLAGCSTAGEILGNRVHSGTLALTAVDLGGLTCRLVHTELESAGDSFAAGVRLGRQLAAPGLGAVFILAPGLGINGSALVDGIVTEVGSGPALTGGLAGDGEAFRETLSFDRDGSSSTRILALGFGGEGLRCATGSFGGWTAFGPMQKVTRAQGNLLFELGGESALTVYRRYLKGYADGLPASGLLFPFEMFSARREPEGIIRTILGVDEAAGSLTLAGDIDPEGYLRLMHAGREALVRGAEQAARAVRAGAGPAAAGGLALLVSCVGRKLVLGQYVEEEIQAVADRLGPALTLAGFYAYGEIGPLHTGRSTQLHNQTMTITWIREEGPAACAHEPAG